jgi:exopolysaccharide production negative regulator
MRTFSGTLAALAICGAAAGALAGGGVKYASPQAAFEQGLGAYKSGYYEIAIPALEEAAAKGAELNRFFAEFYLARIYSDNSGALTDHAKAYVLFQKLVDENADADPDDGRRAPFVAKALTALAGYLRQGVRKINVKPDPEGAAKYLRLAATFFRDHDAQFELAKIYLSDGSNDEDLKHAKHYLSVLSEEGHAGAQALLADLLWRGRYIKKDERRALALITMAVENAPGHERLWIDDIYQNIFCGTSQGTRKQADGIVAVWRKVFAQRSAPAEPMGLGLRELQPLRKCENGEVLDIRRNGEQPAVASTPAAARPEAMQGGAASFGLRDAGAAARKK